MIMRGRPRPRHTAAGALALVAACTVAACGKTTGPSRGGLMLIVSTEGSLPVGRLDVSVTSGDTSLLSQSYKLPEEAQLPTTIALVSNGNPAAEATISVTGWEVIAGQADIPLDRRDAIVTQIPTDRVAELRIVLSAQCTKWVDGSGLSACPKGYTCDSTPGDSTLGACVAQDVAATNLGSYQAGDETNASGGSSASGGDAGISGAAAATGGSGGSGGNGVAGGGGSSGGGAGALCGNGVLDGTEPCDDGNTDSGDGCSAACKVEQGWDCTQAEPSKCAPICGDGLVVGAEAKTGGCDDQNTRANDGCAANCKVEAGYVCSGAPSVCAKTCGDGKLDTGEACDDGNATAGDGCFDCAVESGYICDTKQPSTCAHINECTANRKDCDGNTNNGCETPTGTDPTNCGGCGVQCKTQNASGTTCGGGNCAPACNNGFAACSNPAAGCLTSINTAAHCGNCATSCAGGTPFCASRSCVAHLDIGVVNSNTNGTQSNQSTDLSVTHTLQTSAAANAYRMVIVGVTGFGNGAAGLPSGVTYNGVPMTLAHSIPAANQVSAAIYYIKGAALPPNPGMYTVYATSSGSNCFDLTANVVELINVEQATNPVDTVGGSANVNSCTFHTPSDAIAVPSGGEFVYTIASVYGPPAPGSAPTGQTVVENVSLASLGTLAGYFLAPAVGSRTATWTVNACSASAHALAAFKPAITP